MQESSPRFKKYLFVCEHSRDDGACCSPEGGKIREILKERVKARGLSGVIRVSRSGCLDVCAEGPNVLLAPDYVWFSRVVEGDIDAIIERARQGV